MIVLNAHRVFNGCEETQRVIEWVKKTYTVSILSGLSSKSYLAHLAAFKASHYPEDQKEVEQVGHREITDIRSVVMVSRYVEANRINEKIKDHVEEYEFSRVFDALQAAFEEGTLEKEYGTVEKTVKDSVEENNEDESDDEIFTDRIEDFGVWNEGFNAENLNLKLDIEKEKQIVANLKSRNLKEHTYNNIILNREFQPRPQCYEYLEDLIIIISDYLTSVKSLEDKPRYLVII